MSILKHVVISAMLVSIASCSSFNAYEQTTLSQNKQASDIILNIRNLDVDKNYRQADENLKQFIKGYQQLDKGRLNEAITIFEQLKNSQNKQSVEYGEYGLLISAYETENLPQMLACIQRIKKLDDKSDWLNNELRSYEILYYILSAEFSKARRMLDSIEESEVSASPLLSAMVASLYIRNNELERASEALSQLNIESEYSIEMQAYLISITKGSMKAIEYLADKVQKYPDNELLKLIYNSYLVNIDKEKADSEAYQLGLKSENPYIIVYSIDILMTEMDRDSQEALDKIGVLGNKLYQLDSANAYIDYYLFKIAVPPNTEKIEDNIDTANKFNPMNYRLLLNEYYIYPEDERLNILKKIENIDPHSYYVLMLLADFYAQRDMRQELDEIMKRFATSKRFKTQEQIEFMNSF